jgi:catechol 2,3-dioxygenase-like lactoylglutathione lyase family enzyme
VGEGEEIMTRPNGCFSHVTLGSNDMERSSRFYDAVLAPLGMTLLHRYEGEAYGYGRKGIDELGSPVWIVKPFDGRAAVPGNGVHIAFVSPNRHAVDQFHATALKLGGKDEGKPGLRPHYHEHYYAAYVRDPDGNKLQAVCHDPE